MPIRCSTRTYHIVVLYKTIYHLKKDRGEGRVRGEGRWREEERRGGRKEEREGIKEQYQRLHVLTANLA